MSGWIEALHSNMGTTMVCCVCNRRGIKYSRTVIISGDTSMIHSGRRRGGRLVEG